MIFSPERLTISRAIAGSPFKRAKFSGSLNVLLISAISLTFTTESPPVLSGIFMMSNTLSNSPGTLMAKRPAPVSKLPAATNLFELLKKLTISTPSKP